MNFAPIVTTPLRQEKPNCSGDVRNAKLCFARNVRIWCVLYAESRRNRALSKRESADTYSLKQNENEMDYWLG